MSKLKKICFRFSPCRVPIIIALLFNLVQAETCLAGVLEKVQLYDVHEITLSGPTYGSVDSPTCQVDLVTKWRHESGQPSYQIYGFWDSNGKGGQSGNVFKVRFCPTKLGKWTLVKTTWHGHLGRVFTGWKPVPQSELNGQKEGYSIVCVSSFRKGFWEVDEDDARGRWYKRSDGSHQYIFGNTMYSFLSEYDDKGPTGGNIADDISRNSRYFKKVRFSITGDRYPHPEEKPFLDNSGKPTDNGNFSHRPNPAWFYNRVDLAVREAFNNDLIADLILNGPDTKDSRSVLAASENAGDCTPILKYIAARYGSYPNVWICLSNEFDIKNPRYQPKDIVRFGTTMRKYLPYPTPMSVHSRPRDWDKELNARPWHDHVIIQKKLKKMPIAADWVSRNHYIGGNVPIIDDELAYEGKGDGWSEPDVIESHLGAFLGGGYGTTGHKPASKRGHYFHGNFKASEHKSADNLLWFRRVIDKNITFWKMAPVPAFSVREAQVRAPVRGSDTGDTSIGIFQNIDGEFRAMEWPGHEYVLGTNKAHKGILAKLPEGKWQVIRYDIIAKKQKQLSFGAVGTFTFDAPDSRAVLFHFKKCLRPK